MAYKRVTEEDRRHIYRWRQGGDGPREIARRLGRAASSISREIARTEMNPDAELGSRTVILRTENTHHWEPAREARTFS